MKKEIERLKIELREAKDIVDRYRYLNTELTKSKDKIVKIENENRELEDKKNQLQKGQLEMGEDVEKFKSLYIQNTIYFLVVSIAVLTRYGDVYIECGQWFVAIADKFLYVWRGLSIFASRSFLVVDSVAIGTILILILGSSIATIIRYSIFREREISMKRIREMCVEIFKFIYICRKVIVVTFVICLVFYKQFKEIMDVNIFSIWIIVFLVGSIVLEFLGGFMRDFVDWRKNRTKKKA